MGGVMPFPVPFRYATELQTVPRNTVTRSARGKRGEWGRSPSQPQPPPARPGPGNGTARAELPARARPHSTRDRRGAAGRRRCQPGPPAWGETRGERDGAPRRCPREDARRGGRQRCCCGAAPGPAAGTAPLTPITPLRGRQRWWGVGGG